MMNSRLLFCWIWLSISCLGCEKVISIDLPEHEPVLVVNALFSTDSVWQARVTASQAIDGGSEAKPVTDATVVIWENGLPIDTLVHDSADYYVSIGGRKPVADHSYTLRASAPGFAAVQGSDRAPRVVIPSNLVYRDSVAVATNGQYEGEFSFAFRDWAGERNHYVLDIYQVYRFVWDNRIITQVISVNFTSPNPIMDTQTANGQALFDDTTFDGEWHTVRVQFPNHQLGSPDTVYARLSVVTEPFFRYTQAMGKYWNASFDPFAEPVRLYSNMTAGMGVFAGRASYRMLVP